LVEAPNPHGMVPTSTIYIYKVFKTIHMLWMGRWINNHAFLAILVGKEFGESEDFLDHSETATRSQQGCK
jgi:hypothetical protein